VVWLGSPRTYRWGLGGECGGVSRPGLGQQLVEVGSGELPLERGGDLRVAAAEGEQMVLEGVEVGEVVRRDDLALHDGEVEAHRAGIERVKRDRPDRFGAFATLPLPDVEESLAQIAYALDVLELDGVSMLTNAGGRYLGDSRFDPIFTELQRRAAVVFVHPTASPDPIAHTLGLPDSLLDYPVDTSRAIAKLHYSNTFARTPDVKYVFAHADGTIPFVASRFAIVDEMNVIPEARERGAFADALPRLYWDTASAFSDPCSTCCDRSLGSETSCSGPIIRILATQSRSLAYVSFRTPLSLTTPSAAALRAGRPLG
jgi:hypothetical protein